MIAALCMFAVFAADDPIAEKLNAARASHKEALEELKEPTLKWIAKQEAAVKRSGDKKALKEAEDFRGFFERNGEPPPGLPVNLQKKYAASAASLEKAYLAAVRAYRQEKNLMKAAEIDKEWLAFRIEGRGNLPAELRDGAACLIVASCSKMALAVDPTESPGGAFVVQRPADDADEQQHWLVHRRGSGLRAALAFQHRKYGLFMNVLGGSRGNGAEIILYSKNGRGGNEQWFPTRRGAWLTFTGAESRLLLAIPAGTKDPGARLIQWSTSNDEDQRFKLIPIRSASK